MTENSKESSQKIFGYPPQTPEQRLFWEVLFLFVIIITVGLFGHLASTDVIYTIIISAIFGISLALRFFLINEKGDWLFFLLGILAGGGNDLMSMIRGVYSYTSITILPCLPLPFWMILFWGQVFLIFRKVFKIKWLQGAEFQKNGPLLKGWLNVQLIVDLIILVCLRIIIYSTYMNLWLPGIIYGAIIGVRVIAFPPKKNELLIIAILPYAFIFEGIMVSIGLYVYINPIFLGLPIWLFLWWIFLVPILLKEVFDRMEYYFKNKRE
jgi:hypothetical protein